MQAYIEFETKIREQLFEEQKISFSIIDETDMDEAERLKIILMAQGGEDGPSEGEQGLRLLKTVEELRVFIEQGYKIENYSSGRYEEFFLPEVDNAPEEIRSYFLQKNNTYLQDIIKAIPKLSDNFIESLLKSKFMGHISYIDNLAKSLQSRDSGAYLLNIYFKKENYPISQRDIIFKYFPDKLEVFENKLVKGYLQDKDKSIFINHNVSNFITNNIFNVIMIDVDLNVVRHKNKEMKFCSLLLARHLLTIYEQLNSCTEIETRSFIHKVEDNEITSIKMFFHLSKKDVFNRKNIEQLLDNYFDFLTEFQDIEGPEEIWRIIYSNNLIGFKDIKVEEKLASTINAWISSNIRTMRLELNLKDKSSINKTSKI